MRLLSFFAALAATSLLAVSSCTRSGAADSAGLKQSAVKADTTAFPGTPDSLSDTTMADSAGTVTKPSESDESSALISDTASGSPAGKNSENLLFGIPVDSYNIVTGRVRRNQFIASILSSHGVEWNDIEKLLRDNRETFDPRRVRSGSNYSVLLSRDTLSKPEYFIYQHDPRVTYVFSLKDTLAIYRYDAEIRRMLRYSSGVITTSLWETAKENNLNPNLSAELSEIYAWTIDFFGLQKGDRFKVIYEEEFIGEESVGIRRVHAAQFEHAGSTIYAIPFIQDSVMSFYDTTGASLRKAFLKAPLRYSRISSRFSGARRHPILKIVRPHHGIDYAAPIGTPVVAIGDGRVTSTTYEGGAGRMVRITHNSVYSTAYLHLSRFGPGIAPGVYVKQGQVIGYVGSTGLSTGPHLDFRFYRNGSAVDPLKVEAPPVNPVAPEAMEEFGKIAEGYISLLSTISY
ncbi:MAG: peptidoglycan DD-metalloendopeptidase family protein [Bacteroidales bacterium]|jgi:murein DD-endopeptidase MepM/ murein hydrolase activator NlpD|nr:peptidoglycan DD-metalloendopeptidase family protein [Bacteroidales bacterium]MCB9029055.1 peptidoglycan DD-metalloendopeptidase family protein [Bacteroidales bacterium]HNT93316.1 peptidoglycan DD-metalloendopeptidase family protein [Bacteroidales bacterium]HOO66611.1 peptidoglycan DD-metalloendopeptidase family protein [Bacteroidales bacterium]HPE22358.1 peptidoglycan DD-metalloendopeptidase family protein [Bacteroidales bacterium]